jgi:hypothetical protein
MTADMFSRAKDLILSGSLPDVHQKLQNPSDADPVEATVKNLFIESSASKLLQIPNTHLSSG